MSQRGQAYVVKSRKRVLTTVRVMALACGGSLVATVAVSLLVGWCLGAVAFSGCYATTGPVQTCAENPHQDGCLPPIHDEWRSDAGR